MQYFGGKLIKHVVSKDFIETFSINILWLAKYVKQEHQFPHYVDKKNIIRAALH